MKNPRRLPEPFPRRRMRGRRWLGLRVRNMHARLRENPRPQLPVELCGCVLEGVGGNVRDTREEKERRGELVHSTHVLLARENGLVRAGTPFTHSHSHAHLSTPLRIHAHAQELTHTDTHLAIRTHTNTRAHSPIRTHTHTHQRPVQRCPSQLGHALTAVYHHRVAHPSPPPLFKHTRTHTPTPIHAHATKTIPIRTQTRTSGHTPKSCPALPLSALKRPSCCVPPACRTSTLAPPPGRVRSYSLELHCWCLRSFEQRQGKAVRQGRVEECGGSSSPSTGRKEGRKREATSPDSDVSWSQTPK